MVLVFLNDFFIIGFELGFCILLGWNFGVEGLGGVVGGYGRVGVCDWLVVDLF